MKSSVQSNHSFVCLFNHRSSAYRDSSLDEPLKVGYLERMLKNFQVEYSLLLNCIIKLFDLVV